MQLFKFAQCALLFVFCTITVFAQSSGDVDAAAKDAIRRLEDALSGKRTTAEIGTAAAQNTSLQSVSAQVTRGGTEPRWINDPYTIYNRTNFIAAVGSSANRAEAEKKALAALTAIFGQSVRSDFNTVTMYSEAVNNGIVTVSDNNRIRDEVSAAASMDKLVGAEIGYVWDSGRGVVYAAAYMEKSKTIAIYTEMININNLNIDLLTKMSAVEKNTLDGLARYKLASLISGINAKYASVISQCGGSSVSLNIKDANSLNLEASNIVKNITITVDVKNDRANRIRDAFAKVLSSEGLRTRGNNPPYTLEVNLEMSEATFPNNKYIFCRYAISANLIENATGAVLLPFAFSDRDGDLTYVNAEATAISTAEKIIAERYSTALREYFTALMPVN